MNSARAVKPESVDGVHTPLRHFLLYYGSAGGKSRISKIRRGTDGRELTEQHRYARTSVYVPRNQRSRSPESVFKFGELSACCVAPPRGMDVEPVVQGHVRIAALQIDEFQEPVCHLVERQPSFGIEIETELAAAVPGCPGCSASVRRTLQADARRPTTPLTRRPGMRLRTWRSTDGFRGGGSSRRVPGSERAPRPAGPITPLCCRRVALVGPPWFVGSRPQLSPLPRTRRPKDITLAAFPAAVARVSSSRHRMPRECHVESVTYRGFAE